MNDLSVYVFFFILSKFRSHDWAATHHHQIITVVWKFNCNHDSEKTNLIRLSDEISPPALAAN